MDHELEEFLAWVAEQRKRTTRSGVRYPKEKRTWAADYARRRMARALRSARRRRSATTSLDCAFGPHQINCCGSR